MPVSGPGTLRAGDIFNKKKEGAGPLVGLIRIMACLAGLVGLASCDGVGHTAPNRASAKVAGEVVELAVPPGYCFDMPTSDRNSRGAFFLAVTCDAGPGKQNVVITISVSNSGLTGDLDQLEAFLKTDGAPALGKSGAWDKVSVLTTRQRADTLFIKVHDRGRQPIEGAPETFWRAFFESGERMIGLSVAGIAGTRLSDGDATALLAQVAAHIRAVNRQGGA